MDRILTSVHRFFIIRYPSASIGASFAVYVCIVLLFGSRLAVSSNYFVILPVFVVSLVFGLAGGAVSGALALPMNLTLFRLIGHSEFSPASKGIAEFSGLFVGVAFGYLADYFKKLNREVARRVLAEAELRRGYAEKDMLLRELQHRVKNNLNMIKSIVQLQRSRSADPVFREASGLLLNRIYAVAFAHDTLFDGGLVGGSTGESRIEIEPYLRTIAENVSIAYPDVDVAVSVALDGPETALAKNLALNLGLVVNEAAVNAAKHAFSHVAEPRLDISLQFGGDRWRLVVRDNGIGFPDPSVAAAKTNGLGRAIIQSVAERLSGAASWRTEGGTVFELVFPRPRSV